MYYIVKSIEPSYIHSIKELYYYRFEFSALRESLRRQLIRRCFLTEIDELITFARAAEEGSKRVKILKDMVLSSSRKMNTFVILALLTVALLTDHSHGIMGWFGNGGKRPDGRRSLITVRY